MTDPRPLNENMLAVFGVLREADELELDTTQLSVRTGLSWRAVAGAVTGLRRRGLVRSRRGELERLHSLANGRTR